MYPNIFAALSENYNVSPAAAGMPPNSYFSPSPVHTKTCMQPLPSSAVRLPSAARLPPALAMRANETEISLASPVAVIQARVGVSVGVSGRWVLRLVHRAAPKASAGCAAAVANLSVQRAVDALDHAACPPVVRCATPPMLMLTVDIIAPSTERLRLVAVLVLVCAGYNNVSVASLGDEETPM